MILKVDHITTGYDKQQVLLEFSLELRRRETVVLAGGNGSGKSTLLKVIARILPVWNGGHIWFDGEDITECGPADLLRKGLLYIPQKDGIFERLTVAENLELSAASIHHRSERRRRIKEVIDEFNVIENLLDRSAGRLSGGQQKLVTLAMATLHRPKMIMIDEPFAGLTHGHIVQVTERFRVLHAQGVTILLVEHRLKDCLSFSQRLVGLRLGSVMYDYQIAADFNIDEINSIFV